MKLTLNDRINRAPQVESFIFEPDQAIDWKAGQYLKLTIEQEQPDDRGLNRFFSISSAPSEHFIMITTRFALDKGSSFKKDLFNFKAGDQLEAIGPYGDFVLPEDIEGKKFCFIAGGIGITPFRSMLKELDMNGQKIDLNLLYANRDGDIPFKYELEQFKKHNEMLITNYIIDPERVDQPTVELKMPDYKERIFYVSGPEPMVESLMEMLMKMGVVKDEMKRDYFPGYTNI